jgi:L,D-transpeptidase YcbB
MKNRLPRRIGLLAFAASCSILAGLVHGQSAATESLSYSLSTQDIREVQAILAAGKLPELNDPDFGAYQGEVEEFYAYSGGALAWLQGNKPTTQAWEMMQFLKTADRKGLDPEDYDASHWNSRVVGLDRSNATSASELARFDVALTISTLRYVSDLQSGRINPQTVHSALGTKWERIGLAEFVRREIAEGSDVNAAVSAVEPPFPTYYRTLKALETYLELARKDDGTLLPAPPRIVRPGDNYAGLPRLQRLLVLLGDLSAADAKASSLIIYQGKLVDAVKHFQQRHGLQPDGRLGAQTMKELNTPLSSRIRQLQLTIERWRWVPREFDRPPVVVNIPEFRVRAMDEEYHWALSMKVVVGKAYDHQTPVFSSSIQSVIFRPYWDVPSSIALAELLPKIRKDSRFLAANAYEIVDRRGEVMSHQTVDPVMVEGLRSGRLRIRQRPGPNNSLGLVKFNFPNPYDVYMHGTPATELFSRSRRDFSHGCIRVEDPLGLAAWLLKDQPEWTADRIKQAMYGEKTIQVAIEKPIPVLIVYGTVVVMEDGEVRFFDDIYGGDAELEHALAIYESRSR